MIRSDGLGLFALGAIVLSSACAAGAERPSTATRPNVVFILADDLGWGDLGCYGSTKTATPHCDRLAREGRRFTDAHSPSGVCSPTRFGLLTGTYPWRENRVPRHLHASEPLAIRDGEPTVASVLKSAGYATGCVGKWHLGAQRQDPIDWNAPLEPGPNAVGFDYYFGVINSHNQAPFVYVENTKILGLKPGERIAVEGNSNQTAGPKLRKEMDLEAAQSAKAAEFIDKNHDRPFFLYYPTAAVHNPLTPGQAWQGKSQAGPYGDYVQEFDAAVGAVLTALDRHEIADQTIVVVSSDNGAIAEQGAQWGHKPVGELRGRKQTAYEGGHRVPFLVRWPGRVPAGTVSDTTICHVDFFATICAALGLDLPRNAAADSFNVLSAWLDDESPQPVHDGMICVAQNASTFSMRRGPWKVIVPAKGDDATAAAELYNLADDLKEQQNLAASEPEKLREMLTMLSESRERGFSRPGYQPAAR